MLALLLVTAAFGLIVGSFLNVVIHRVPRGSLLDAPRSACTWCGGMILARDNIPVISFLLLGARCRHCGAPISWRYPFVEALTAALFVACVARFEFTLAAAAAALFCALMVALAMIDVEHFLLPDAITMPGIVAGLLLQPFLPATSFLDAALGALCGAGVLILIINFWFWMRSEEGMGLGDVNMLALIGAFLGWQGAAVSLIGSALIGAVTGVALMATGRVGLRSRLPFGVFLAIAGLFALFFGAELVELYLDLL